MSEAPIPYASVGRKVRSREALRELDLDSIDTTVYLAGREPRLEVVGMREVRPSHGGDEEPRLFALDVRIDRKAIGRHTFAPGVDGTRLPARRPLLDEDEHGDVITGFLPDHLALRTRPQKLDRRLQRPLKVDAVRFPGDPQTRWATTVFAPDDRYTFSDTAFPWCTAGRVETSSGGWASGVMIGPRHLLTCSHAMGWINPPNPYVAGWVKFTPSYFDGSEPFGVAWGVHVYWQEQVTPPTISGTEGRNDYVVVVLDRRLGDITGWMGSRTYDDSWDGGAYWSHVGYPADISGGTRPTFQGGISLDGDDDEPSTNQQLYHQGDVWPGQSGGPYFGWWSGEPWPRVVADQSWQNTTQNGASGGSHLVDLVIRARNDFP